MGNVPSFHNYKIYRGAGKYCTCHRLSLGMAKTVCEDIASLLMNEKCSITVADDVTNAFVHKVLEDNSFDTLANQYQERKAALGTVAYVPYLSNLTIDEEGHPLTGEIKINFVTAENIFPISWENGKITECAFAFRKTIARKQYVHLQLHRLNEDGTYYIQNIILNDKNRELTEEELEAFPTFRGLVPYIETGSKKPQYVIDKLAITNNADEDFTNPMGISIFANALDVLKKIDFEYDSFGQEFQLGRKRIFVAPELLTSKNGEPVFDISDGVFYQLPEDFSGNDDSKSLLQESNMALRVTEHEQAINDDLNYLSMKCGFGQNHYRFKDGSIQTATQVISENSDMYRTIRKHEIVLESVLKDLCRKIIELGQALNIEGLKLDADIRVDFDDSIIEDRQAERSRDREDVGMGAMSLAEYRSKYYGETLEEAKKNLPASDEDVME